MCEKDQLAKMLVDIERIQKLVRDSDAQVMQMNLQLVEQLAANGVTDCKLTSGKQEPAL